MKKFFWVVVAILMLATFSDHPRLKPYKDQLYGLFAETAGNASQVHGEQVLRTIQSRFASFSAELGQKQQEELDADRTKPSGIKRVLPKLLRG